MPRLSLSQFLNVWGEPERWEYDVIAANIHAGNGHTYERGPVTYAAYAPPLWSYILAGLLALQGSTRASIQVFQGLLCFGTALTASALTRRLGGTDRESATAAILVALQPSLLYYSVVKSDPLPLNAFLLMQTALWGCRLIDAPTLARGLGFGLLVSAATLSRGTPAVAAPILIAVLFARFRLKALAPSFALTLALFAGLAPWLLRNRTAIGETVIASTTSENFWRGNNPFATGGVVGLNGERLTELDPSNKALPESIQKIVAQGGPEAALDQSFRIEAWNFLRAHRGDAARLFARKLRAFWWRIDSEPRDYDPAAARLYEWLYRLEAGLAVIGVVTRFKDARNRQGARETLAFTMFLALGISLAQSAFYVQGRHRFLIEPLLLVFAATGVERLRYRVSASRK